MVLAMVIAIAVAILIWTAIASAMLIAILTAMRIGIAIPIPLFLNSHHSNSFWNQADLSALDKLNYQRQILITAQQAGQGGDVISRETGG